MLCDVGRYQHALPCFGRHLNKGKAFEISFGVTNQPQALDLSKNGEPCAEIIHVELVRQVADEKFVHTRLAGVAPALRPYDESLNLDIADSTRLIKVPRTAAAGIENPKRFKALNPFSLTEASKLSFQLFVSGSSLTARIPAQDCVRRTGRNQR